jgi:hypothetical protein
MVMQVMFTGTEAEVLHRVLDDMRAEAAKRADWATFALLGYFVKRLEGKLQDGATEASEAEEAPLKDAA